MNKELLTYIPQKEPFRFVDEITEVTDDYIKGFYKLRKTEFFYKGHFPNNPITPGVIIIEIMAQIGLVAYGIYLFKKELNDDVLLKNNIYFTSSNVRFKRPSYPDDIIYIESKKISFRFNKLKCKVKALNSEGQVLCLGVISGILK